MSPYEWAYFSVLCELPLRLVSADMKKMADKILKALPGTVKEVEAEGADRVVVSSVCEVVTRLCKRHLAMAPLIKGVDLSEFKVDPRH